LLAKRLLTDTPLTVTGVAMASGFGSLRRFNALFRSRYRLSPSDLRKRMTASSSADVLTFQLGYRPPLDWNRLLEFLSKRSIDGVEQIDGARYQRDSEDRPRREATCRLDCGRAVPAQAYRGSSNVRVAGGRDPVGCWVV
jgi:hypothetical protein